MFAMDSLEEDEEKTNIYIIDEDGAVTHSEADDSNSKSFMEKLCIDQQVYSSEDGEDVPTTTKNDTADDATPQKRILFGPPSWNPEQLATAIKAVVQEGSSLSVAARKNGIPRTTLANKIYGRKRRKTDHASQSMVSSTGCMFQNPPPASHTSLIAADQERFLAEFLSRQRHVDSYSMTRATFDLVKYLAFANDRKIANDDEELKEWLKFFFLRYPTTRFTVWHTERGLFETEEGRTFMDFITETRKTENAEEVKRKLFILVKQTFCHNVHLFWWYTFLISHKKAVHYFLEKLKWPEAIMGGCHVECADDEKMQNTLTKIILNRCSTQSHLLQNNTPSAIGKYSSTHSSNQNFLSVSSANQNQSCMSSSNHNRPFVAPIEQTHNELTVQFNSRQRFDVTQQQRRYPSNAKLEDVGFESPSSDLNITSSTSMLTHQKLPSFSVMLAKEGLQAVERKLSSEDLRYFSFRYENPQLDEAYQVWRNLKAAVDKKDIHDLDAVDT